MKINFGWIVAILASFALTVVSHKRHWKRCPPGSGLGSRPGCEKCVRGQNYSSRYSFRSCLPCSRCGVGLYEAHPCTPSRDTICDDCTRGIFLLKLQDNRNFRENCNYLHIRKIRKRHNH